MQAAVHRAAVVVLPAEILPRGFFLIFRDVQCVLHELVHALVFRGGDGNDRNAQHGFHRVHVHGAAVAGHLIHHVQGDDHGDAHLQQLHGKVEVPLDIGRVDDIDDAFRLFLQYEVAGDQLLAGVGRHRIDAGKVCDQGVFPADDHAVLPVHGDAGKIADVLAGSGQLVEERRLAAVLVADEGKGEERAVRQRIAASLRMEAPAFAETGVLIAQIRDLFFLFRAFFGQRSDADLPGLVQAESQLVAVDADLQGVAHRRVLDHGHFGTGNDPHVEKMLAQRALAADFGHCGGLSYL